MININGNLYSNIDSKNIVNLNFIVNSHNLCEEIHFENNVLFFWEDHFFRIMASLRRLRFNIPLSFNNEFLKNELIKTIKANKLEKKSGNIKFHFFSKINEDKINYLIFLNVSDSYSKLNFKHSINCDVFSEEFIKSGLFSNLSVTNINLRRIAHIYSIENGFDTCIMLNEKKKYS